MSAGAWVRSVLASPYPKMRIDSSLLGRCMVAATVVRGRLDREQKSRRTNATDAAPVRGSSWGHWIGLVVSRSSFDAHQLAPS
jgi:hypothetical protein